MLTDAKIKRIKPVGGKTRKESNSGGLQIWVYPSGKKIFKIKYRYNKKERRDTVGEYPSVTLSKARERREEIKEFLKRGLDPAREKVKAKEKELDEANNTFSAVADSYLDKMKMHSPPRAPATIKKNQAFIDEAKREFGDVPIRDIDTRIVARLIEKRITTKHFETARRLRTVVGSVFKHALRKGLVNHDPTVALQGIVPTFEVKHRAAMLDINDIGGLMEAIDGDTGQATTKIALKLLILFALRPIELRGAKWAEFDFTAKEFHIPKNRMKARKPHTVMLSDQAVSLLLELKKITGWSEFLFPSNGAKNPFMSENTMNQALRRMGYDGDTVTAHGFRATFSTNANESKLWSPDAVERYCARGDTNPIREIYNRGGYLKERVELADWWSEQVFDAQLRASRLP